MKIRVFWEPRDIWIGVFWRRRPWQVYICLIPCFPILLEGKK